MNFFPRNNFFFKLRQSRWPYHKHALNNRRMRFNTIAMSDRYDQTNGEFLSVSPNIICWDRITSIYILQPFNSTSLHVLFSQAINLRSLSIEYIADWARRDCLSDKTLIDLINDQSLCNILMSNGLRQLNLITSWGQRNLINLAHLIVERLPHLQAIELHSGNVELIEMASIFINGLSKLSFVALSGCVEIYKIYQKEITLWNSNTRSFRMEMSTAGIKQDTLLIWL